MFQHSSSYRRRFALLASGSLSAAWLAAAAGLGDVVLAPTQAFAANECGDPTVNGADPDTFACSGSYGAIVYPTTDGDLTLQLQNDVSTSSGGLVVTTASSDAIMINRLADTSGNGPSLTSITGAGLDVSRTSGDNTITIDLSDAADINAPIDISGTTAGIRAYNVGCCAVGLTTTSGTIAASDGAGIELGETGLDRFTINNGSVVTGSTAAVLITQGGRLLLSNNETGVLNGALQFHNSLRSRFVNLGAWNASGSSFLGDGESIVENNAFSVIATNIDGAAATIDFGDGVNTFQNDGMLAVGGGDESAATLIISNLQTWNNTRGGIYFGTNADRTGSDGVANDRIVVSTPTAFTGDNALMLMDVAFAGAGQANCTAAADADCFDLRGSTTAGATAITVTNLGGPGSLAPIVLVDVQGGVSADEHFTLSDHSGGWLPIGTEGVIATPLFNYELGYDAARQQHLLIPHAGGQALAVPMTPALVNSVWDATTGYWQNRQADLRDNLAARDGSAGGLGLWLKGVGNNIERHAINFSTVSQGTLPADNSYLQETRGFVGGIDLVNVGGQDFGWVVGLTGGRVKSDVDFKVGGSSARLDGHSLGAYASMVSGGFFVDAIVNANRLDVKYHVAGLADAPAKAETLGFQTEAGYRFPLGVGYLEPLAVLSYVSRDMDDLQLTDDVTASFDKGKTFRGALGLRLGGLAELPWFNLGTAITGRVWDEFTGDHSATINSAGQTLSLEDGDTAATLGDIGATLNLISKDGRLTGFADYGFKFRQGYSDSTASVGLRFNW